MHIILSFFISSFNYIQFPSYWYENYKCESDGKEFTIFEALKQEFKYFKPYLDPEKLEKVWKCSNEKYDLISYPGYLNITSCYPSLCPDSINLHSTKCRVESTKTKFSLEEAIKHNIFC